MFCCHGSGLVAALILVCTVQGSDGWCLHPSASCSHITKAAQAAASARQCVSQRPSSSWRLFQASSGSISFPLNDTEPNSMDQLINETSSQVGIGGKDGVVYDVNKLKRNIVQEMVRDFKSELWGLLSDPNSDNAVVEDKLAALVQTNAVSTTTDSNLLDGRWSYVFGSRQSASTLLDPRRFDITVQQKPMASIQVGGKVSDAIFSYSCREIHLEDLHDSEDAYVKDQTSYFGGLVRHTRRYQIQRLTRTTLELALTRKQWNTWGRLKLWGRTLPKDKLPPKEFRVLYIDSDLCIATTSNDLTKSAFHVYTKSDAWVSRGQRLRRRMTSAVGRYFWTFVHLRRILWSRLPSLRRFQSSASSTRPVMLEVERGADKRVRVVTLGDLENDDKAWDGDEDPFVHLSADERQQHLKRMRVRDVARAGRRQQRRKARLSQKQKTERRVTPKPFKKPEENFQ